MVGQTLKNCQLNSGRDRLCNKNYSQTNQNNHYAKTQNIFSNKVLLDSICNYLLISSSVSNTHWYSVNRKLFSNQLSDSGSGFNYGFISIDTLKLAIRFNHTGTTGSGGFAPYIQQTFYFQDFSSFFWHEEIENNIILYLISSYDNCNGNYKPIAEFEKTSGCRNSEDRVVDIPDYAKSWFSEYKIEFNKNIMTNEVKDKLSDWFNELKNR